MFLMLELQERISGAQSATEGLRRDLVHLAAKEYFQTLSVAGSPAADDFDAAQVRANTVLKQGLLSASSATVINDGTELDAESLAALALGFETLVRPLRIPRPVVTSETRTITLAFAGLLGALGGMLALALLMRLAFDMRDLGLVLGGPLGALLAVLVAHRLSRISLLTRILPWAFTRPKPLRGNVRRQYEKAVRASVEQWVEWAVSMLAVLCFHRLPSKDSQTDRDKAFRRLAKVIYALHQAGPGSLAVVADELIQEARNSGFEGLEGRPAFVTGGGDERDTLVWKKDLQGKYEAFGHVVEGEQVIIERPAVIFDGRIVQRGLVRKVRDRT